MVEKDVGPELSEGSAAQLLGVTKLRTEPSETPNSQNPTQDNEALSALSEADKATMEALVKATLSNLDWTPRPVREGFLSQVGSAPSLSTIVDSSGKPIEPPGTLQVNFGESTTQQEAFTFITIRPSELEKLNAKTSDVLRLADLAFERIAKSREEIERLKRETREVLVQLRAA